MLSSSSSSKDLHMYVCACLCALPQAMQQVHHGGCCCRSVACTGLSHPGYSLVRPEGVSQTSNRKVQLQWRLLFSSDQTIGDSNHRESFDTKVVRFMRSNLKLVVENIIMCWGTFTHRFDTATYPYATRMLTYTQAHIHTYTHGT